MEDLQKMREELAKLAKIAKIAKTVNQWKVEVHPSKHLVKDEKENKRNKQWVLIHIQHWITIINAFNE